MTAPQMPQPWDSLGRDHFHVLDQVLGRERARTFFFDVACEFGCAYCGALPGRPCTIEGSTRETVSDAAWRELAESNACLAEAERELREMAARVGIADPESLLRTIDMAGAAE